MSEALPTRDVEASAAIEPSPRKARGRWTVWSVELLALFAAILILDGAMRPGFALLEATPHVFWLPVVAMAVLYGTPAGIAAALAATALAAWRMPVLSPALADHYTQSLALWKEPVLWLLSALVLGLNRDRQEERAGDLSARTERAETQAAGIAAYAATLRAHIGALEQHIALAPEPARDAAPEPVPVSAAPNEVEVEIGAAPERPARLDEIAGAATLSLQETISSTARTLVGSQGTALWVLAAEGWIAVWDEGALASAGDPVAEGAGVEGPGAGPRISPQGIPAPVLDPGTGEAAGLLVLSRIGTSGTDALAQAVAASLASALRDHLPALGAVSSQSLPSFRPRPRPSPGRTPWLRTVGRAS